MLKGEEAHLKCSPEYAEGATIDLTLLQKAEKAISDKTATEKAESENVVAESVSAQQVSTEKVMVEKTSRGEGDYREVYCCKCYSRGGRCEDELRIRTRRRCSRMYQGRQRPSWNKPNQAYVKLHPATRNVLCIAPPGSLIRSLECLSTCCLTFNPTRD